MTAKPKPRSRYGTGNLLLRGTTWHARWREVRSLPNGSVDYVQHSMSTGSNDKNYAQRFLNRKLQETGGHRHTMVDPRKVSYEDLRQNWLVSREEKGMRSLKRGKDGQVVHPTLPRLDKFFDAYRAAEITIADLRRFRTDGHTDGLSDARLNRYMATLRSMFNQAVKDEILTRTELPGYFPMGEETIPPRVNAFIEVKYYAALRKVLLEPMRSAFTLAYHDSVRVEEMKRLRWDAFDFKRRIIYLSEEVTKTGNARIVPIPSDFDLKPGRPEELACPIGDRREVWNEASVIVGAGWFECKKCQARCAIRECPTHGHRAVRGVRYHGPQLRNTRHTAVRNMSDAGMDRTRIKEISGHKSDSMFERYNIGREKDVDEARRTMDAYHLKQQTEMGL
jgi:integrase